MNLYQPEGWLDAGALRSRALPFTWIWGGRGIGKTYGFLKSVRYDDPVPFLLLRRTQTMIDLMSNYQFSPFYAIDQNVGQLTAVHTINKYITGFYNGIKDDSGEIIPDGPPVGYACALSTIHNIRGFSSDAEFIIYDEFIPERHERPIRDEYKAFLNAYETINRNRELTGRDPVRCIALTNANSLSNPYFLGMGVVGIVDKMLSSGREIYTISDRGIMLINITRSPISEKKGRTALYSMAGDSDFSRMALDNEFSGESRSRPRRVPLAECSPLVIIGELCIYKRKTGGYYVCRHKSGSPPVYSTDDADLVRFTTKYFVVWDSYFVNKVCFIDYESEVLFRKYFGAKY